MPAVNIGHVGRSNDRLCTHQVATADWDPRIAVLTSQIGRYFLGLARIRLLPLERRLHLLYALMSS